MRLIVLVCNAGDGMKESLEKHRRVFSQPDDSLYVVDEKSIDYITHKLKSVYCDLKPHDDYDTCVSVFVVNCPVDDLDVLRRKLPAVFFLNFPVTTDKAQRLAGFLRRELAHIRKLLRILRKEMKENDSKTPLLLPIRNFKSNVLDRLLSDIQQFRTPEPDYDVPFRRLIRSAEAKGLKSYIESNKTFFENGRSIRFYGPSKGGPRH